jgi:hypothetical protein
MAHRQNMNVCVKEFNRPMDLSVASTTTINFEPFDHYRGLVQILVKSGYDSYVFGRPLPHHLLLPAEDFRCVETNLLENPRR